MIVHWHDGVRVIHVPAGPERFIRKEELLEHMGLFTSFVTDFVRAEGLGYDIVHANFFMSGIVAAQLRYVFNIPFVMTFHALGKVRRIYQGNADQFPEERLAIEEALVRAADGIIAECPQDRADLVEHYGADPDRITIIPCGFDPHEVWPIQRDLARVVLGFSPKDHLILQLGRIVPRKGIDTVIRGFGDLVKRGIDAKLLIVGGENQNGRPVETAEHRRLKRVATEANISAYVHFMGQCGREELKYYYSAADVFVTMPWYEPFGITPLEAMACGTPVIGADVGGIKYTVRDGENGFLVPARDEEGLARRLELLIREPLVARYMGEQGRARANAEFTWDRVTASAADFYACVAWSKAARQNGFVAPAGLFVEEMNGDRTDVSDSIRQWNGTERRSRVR
jgi:D-inositol-3-phosphate glycosyltransferase